MITLLYGFDIYTIQFPAGIICRAYNDNYHSGIQFEYDGDRYDLVHNKEVNWNRLMVNRKDGSWGDYPFRKEAFHLLPTDIIVRETK